ncbi:hypothetical protein RGV33_18915 [Pseudomonas sp. Bout1]|uniref:hypothetical protein n=1 Tax=Pseudomonas sp. Bout1 TaxID=3048600 RepID=UPI002AB55898|nr:hypothetical protein [Pseudomonas sp. Bout1]MDY7533732.1 hypothetical protein [Pseudomonas sp. Bout1]MEB0189405.1 hypothetical protein [Pseudomonas sp. Bout1]
MNAYLIRISGVLLLMLGFSGWAQNRTLLPPPNGEQVSVTVKLPQNLAAEAMRVMPRPEKYPIRRSMPE